MQDKNWDEYWSGSNCERAKNHLKAQIATALNLPKNVSIEVKRAHA